jgi:hypothetical protein
MDNKDIIALFLLISFVLLVVSGFKSSAYDEALKQVRMSEDRVPLQLRQAWWHAGLALGLAFTIIGAISYLIAFFATR